MCYVCSVSEPDAILKAENEALQDEVRHLRQLLSLTSVSTKTDQLSNSAQANSSNLATSTSCGAGVNTQHSSTTTAMPSGIDAVQLKREELLKWKAVQLERQVTILQGALEVMPCPARRWRLSHIDMQHLHEMLWWYCRTTLSHQALTLTASSAAPSSHLA